jgi:hypothetical protein
MIEESIQAVRHVLPNARYAVATWTIITQTGSSYFLAHDQAGDWWLAADNIPSPRSCSLADGVWAVQEPVPWPPIVGERLWIEAQPLPMNDPRRVPGGGKDTSPVIQVICTKIRPKN